MAANKTVNISAPVVGTSYVNFYAQRQNVSITVDPCGGTTSVVSPASFSLGIGTNFRIAVPPLTSSVVPSVVARGTFNIQDRPAEQQEPPPSRLGDRVGIEAENRQELSQVLQLYEGLNENLDNHNIEQRGRLARAVLDNASPKDRRTIISTLVTHYSKASKRL